MPDPRKPHRPIKSRQRRVLGLCTPCMVTINVDHVDILRKLGEWRRAMEERGCGSHPQSAERVEEPEESVWSVV